MQRIAVLSDIHSNLQALEAVLARVRDLACDTVVCLGDVVGYGARPVECLSIMRGLAQACVQGNHDAMVALGDGDRNVNARALAAVGLNRALLGEADLAWLAALPTGITWDDGTVLAHGAPGDRDRYLLTERDLQDVRVDQQHRWGPGLTFFGHTHLPAWCAAGRVGPPPRDVMEIPVDGRVLVNPGSVGQPRDGDPRAAFAVWDRDAGQVQFQRVPYDIEAARDEILDAGLPPALGDRLRLGR